MQLLVHAAATGCGGLARHSARQPAECPERSFEWQQSTARLASASDHILVVCQAMDADESGSREVGAQLGSVPQSTRAPNQPTRKARESAQLLERISVQLLTICDIAEFFTQVMQPAALTKIARVEREPRSIGRMATPFMSARAAKCHRIVRPDDSRQRRDHRPLRMPPPRYYPRSAGGRRPVRRFRLKFAIALQQNFNLAFGFFQFFRQEPESFMPSSKSSRPGPAKHLPFPIQRRFSPADPGTLQTWASSNS